MKRLVSLLCVLAMAISMFSVVAFAAETETTKATNVEATTVSDDVAGYATSKGLWYEENTVKSRKFCCVFLKKFTFSQRNDKIRKNEGWWYV